MNHESLVSRDDDPLVKSFNDLYVAAKLSTAFTRLPITRAYLEGIRENKISQLDRTTEEVIAETMNSYSDDDIYRYFNL